MSSSDDDIPLEFQKVSVSASFHSELILVLAMGIYTTVFFATVYIYLTRKTSQRTIIVGSLTALYVVVLGQFIVQWILARIAFLDNGATRLSIANSALDGAPVPGIIYLALQYTGYILADGILIWRCFYMCGRSLVHISPLIFLLISEVGLSIASATMQGRLSFQANYDTDLREKQALILDGTLETVTAITSLLGTYIICHRIVVCTRQEPGSKSIYQRVMRLLIESSMMYSVSVLLNAVTDFFVAFAPDSEGLLSFVLSEYLDSVTSVITGLAPTLMVARIALAREDPTEIGSSAYRTPTTVHFQAQSAELSGSTRLHVISIPSREVGNKGVVGEKEDV